MNTSAHTPPPWFAVRDPSHFDTLSTVTAHAQRMIVHVGGKGGSIEEQEANTRLIAAAPELLRELAHLVLLLEPLERDGRLDVSGLATLNGARAAIAKATGVL